MKAINYYTKQLIDYQHKNVDEINKLRAKYGYKADKYILQSDFLLPFNKILKSYADYNIVNYDITSNIEVYYHSATIVNAQCWDSENMNIVKTKVGRIFNFDAFNLNLNSTEKELINFVLNMDEWTEIPWDLLDYTTRQNFRVYLKRIKPILSNRP
jgi:hypothetical protein